MTIPSSVFFDTKANNNKGAWRAVWESAPDVIECPTFPTEEEARAALGRPVLKVVLNEEDHPVQRIAAQMAAASLKAARCNCGYSAAQPRHRPDCPAFEEVT